MILRGLAKLARGDAKGLVEFSGEKEAFSASLAPLIAFPLVGAAITAVSGDWKAALIGLLSRLCAVLALPLIIYEFAHLFGKKSLWLRTATALNWCFWLVLPAIFLAALLGSILVQTGLPITRAEKVVLEVVGFYLLWNRWFVLKAGLQLNIWRALLVLVASLAATALFAVVPWAAGMPAPSLNFASLP
ncbi:MAG: hypothetical protein KGQ26_08210 [Rhodospirillales bacterium]|nr:hypothetical protein [Rhodospirillales bacterium]MDE2319739.1 hypothetical protein [Rhodospirillales bacterium]